ncbi:MAG TPA: ATP-binding protein [Candidatus Binatia bacterium]|nr:ATP-binding protein [Candidatus Binatia bacterium]
MPPLAPGSDNMVQSHHERIHALHDTQMAMVSTLDLRTRLDLLLEKIQLFLPFLSAITVRLLNRRTGALDFLACRNLNEEEWRAQEVRLRFGRAKTVVETRAPLVVRNVQSDARTHNPNIHLKYGLVSYAGFPLIAKGEVLGTLGVYTREEHEFTEEEIEFLVTLTGQAASAIHNAQLYEELVKSNRVKDEFLSVMSHELRTPLNVVMGYTGLIRDGILGGINPKQQEACMKIVSRTQDLLDMVNRILCATTLEATEVEVERRRLNIGIFLDGLKSNFEVLEKDITLVWDYPSNLPEVNTDGQKLKHILQNLITNAIKFTQKGRVTISSRIRREAQGNAQLEFTVADTGIGIAEQTLLLIFEKFKQIDSSETRLYGGVGLGLYIVKKFTEHLGGIVDVESELGKGSTFSVRIPPEKADSLN